MAAEQGQQPLKRFLRVVALRKGKVKPAEFRLRPGEKGLSLFACVQEPGPTEVIEAVRAVGKQGDLAAAVVPEPELRALGLRLVQTPGGTPKPAVNSIHYEARLPWLRSLLLVLRGVRIHDYVNDNLSARLWAASSVLD